MVYVTVWTSLPSSMLFPWEKVAEAVYRSVHDLAVLGGRTGIFTTKSVAGIPFTRVTSGAAIPSGTAVARTFNVKL